MPSTLCGKSDSDSRFGHWFGPWSANMRYGHETILQLGMFIITWASSLENRLFAYAKTKTQISFAVTTKLISAVVFATWILRFLYFLNPKFQASLETSSVIEQPGLCRTWSETPKTSFLTTRLTCKQPM